MSYKIIAIFIICAMSELSAQSTIQYKYDALNRIIEIQYPDGTLIEYSYQPNGNRITKAIQSLPVELFKFDAEKGEEPMTVDVTWTTASEENASHFGIERSNDGGHKYSEIGKIEAVGTSVVNNNYEFIDKSPQVGWNYYRLKMVDTDGSFEYSTTKVVEFKDVDIVDASVFPNPTASTVAIRHSELKVGTGVSLLDAKGKLIHTTIVTSESGYLTLDLSTLPEGTYLIKLHLAKEAKGKRVFEVVKRNE